MTNKQQPILLLPTNEDTTDPTSQPISAMRAMKILHKFIPVLLQVLQGNT